MWQTEQIYVVCIHVFLDSFNQRGNLSQLIQFEKSGQVIVESGLQNGTCQNTTAAKVA